MMKEATIGAVKDGPQVRACSRRRWGVLLFALTACAATAELRPPRSPQAEGFRAGDTLHLGIDRWLSGDYVLDSTGAASLPFCGTVRLSGLGHDEASRKVSTCLVDAGVYETPPMVDVSARSGARVTLLVGPHKKIRAIPYERQLTLGSVLTAALAVEPGKYPRRVTLRRKGVPYVIDLRAIADGVQGDEPIEPDDEIVVAEDLDLRREVDPLPSGRGSGLLDHTAPTVEMRSSCGPLLLEEVGLVTLGAGARHPHVVEVREAIRKECLDATAVEELHAACRRIRSDYESAQRDYGPAHPKTRVLEAQLRLCPDHRSQVGGLGGHPGAPSPRGGAPNSSTP